MDAGEGTLQFDFKTTLITKFESSEFGDIKGNRNFANGFGSTPDLRMNFGSTYRFGDHGVNITARFVGSYQDDQTNNGIDSQTTIDVRYDLNLAEFLGGNDTQLSIGAVNLFDELAPRINARPFFDTEAHDPRGRQIYASFKQSF